MTEYLYIHWNTNNNNRYLEKKFHTLNAAIEYHKKNNPHRKLYNYPVYGQCYIEQVIVLETRECLCE